MSHARALPVLTAALILLATAAPVIASAAEVGTIPEAQALSAAGHKPILVDFWMPG